MFAKFINHSFKIKLIKKTVYFYIELNISARKRLKNDFQEKRDMKKIDRFFLKNYRSNMLINTMKIIKIDLILTKFYTLVMFESNHFMSNET